MSEELFVSLGSVFGYLNCNADSRSIVEGEEILNSNHIILMGVREETEDTKDIFALCLQTSALKSCPHEVKGRLLLSEKRITIAPFSCTCKAGLSGTCKHISAVLLKCTRSNINSLEKLSTTDLKCYWTEKKKHVEEEYGAKPLLETACYAPRVVHSEDLKSEVRDDIFHKVLATCSGSALALHLKGRSKIVVDGISDDNQEVSKEIQQLILKMDSSSFLDSFQLNVHSFQLKVCCRNVYEKHISNVEHFQKCLLARQKSTIWEKERQLRITGSRCYSIYTYSKDDWESKANSYFWPRQFSNKYVQHGIKFEGEALDRYAMANGYNVIKLGLVICRKYPWLAYSPDGIVTTNEGTTKLVEIKCPYEGIDTDATNFIHSCSYLQISAESGIMLKQKHQYYGQIQLGLAILNLTMCDLILYSSKSKSFLNIAVPFNEEFARDLILRTSFNYFNKMLHFICEKNEQT